jgi:RNA polymerase sigma factor (TIGR02999 family)
MGGPWVDFLSAFIWALVRSFLAFGSVGPYLHAMPNTTQLINVIDPGDPQDSEQLLPLVYEELRKLAVVRMANEKAGQTLQATALVHEAWLKITGVGGGQFANRRHFFKAAATAMQQILIDNARRKQRLKHGANLIGDELHESRIAMAAPSEELLAVNDALSALALEDSQAAEVVRMRYFVGMTVPEIADALDLAPRTVDRHWSFARAWLKRTIRASLSEPGGRV